MNKILLANGKLHTLSEILTIYLGEDLYTVFQSQNILFLDKITASNILEVKPFEYNYRRVNGKDSLCVYNSLTNEWISYESLADEYNARNGVYQEIYQNENYSSADIPMQIIHLNGSEIDNSPSNIARIGKNLNCSVGMDYYRSICHSKDKDIRRLATELYPFISLKKQYRKFIDQLFYDAHSHEFSDMPVSWNYLVQEIGSSDSINKYADGIIRENSLHKPAVPNDNALTVYLASDILSNEGKRLTAFMEASLENRGYKVFSPARDIKQPYFSSFAEGTEEYFNSVKDQIANCDLMVVACNDRIGCFVGDTEIRLTKGNTIKIKDMKKRREGYPILTYDTKRKVFVEGFAYCSVCTRKQEAVTVVELTTSETIRCTADHPFLTTSNEFVEASRLKAGTQLKTVYNNYVSTVRQVIDSAETEDMYGIEVMTDNPNFVLVTGGLVAKNSSIEIGLKAGIWLEQKCHAEKVCNTDLDNLTEKELAIINQKTPRIITFSDNGSVPNNFATYGSLCLKHCSTWEELESYLDGIDKKGIDYV